MDTNVIAKPGGLRQSSIQQTKNRSFD